MTNNPETGFYFVWNPMGRAKAIAAGKIKHITIGF